MPEEITLRQKAQHYTVCFIDGCARHDHCLRWQAGRYVPADKLSVSAVNPRNPLSATPDCPAYRDDQPVRMAWGMVGFFHDMPHYQELAIKHDIIDHYCRTRYYRMRLGTQPITPADQGVIRAICDAHGWLAPLQFDRYSEEVQWD